MFNDKFTLKMFYKLWLPGILMTIPYTIGETVDAIVLGNSSGALGLAAISFTLPVFMFYNIIMLSLGLGGASKFSFFLGKGDVKSAEKCFNDVIKFGFFLGVIIAIIGRVFIDLLLSLLGVDCGGLELYQATKNYLEVILIAAPLYIVFNIIESYLINDNHQVTANLGSMAASNFNIILTIFFVAVLKMGTRGAALSSVIANAIGLIRYTPALIDKSSHLHLTDWNIKIKDVLKCFKSGLSVNVSFFYQLIFIILMNNILIRTLGESGVAIFEITQNVSYIFMYLFDGNAKAIQPLVSTYIGECNLEGIKNVKKLGLLSIGVVSVLVATVIIKAPNLVNRLFGYSDINNVEESYFALRAYAISAIIASLYVCYINFYQAVGKEHKSMFMNTLRSGISLISCTIIFSIYFQNHFWLFYIVSEILAWFLYYLWSLFYKEKEPSINIERLFNRTIENKIENMVAIGDSLEEFGNKWCMSKEQIYLLRLGVEELGAVMLKYGFKKQKKGYIHITAVAEEDGSATFHMRDTAGKFNPFSSETKKISEYADYNVDMTGIMVMKEKAKSFSYRVFQGFNTVTLKF